MATQAPAVVSLARLAREQVHVPIKGLSPLIVHRFSEKARTQMLDSMQGVKTPKQPKDPDTEFEASLYRLADGSGYGFPAAAFRQATVRGGARAFGKSVKMTELRQAFSVLADGVDADGTQLVRLVGEPIMREDPVTVGMGRDLRYRAEFRDWSVVLRVEYLPGMVDRDSLLALIDAGGMNGVGEWRPEKNGDFGRYEIAGESA